VADALIVVYMQIAFVYGPNAIRGGTELAERIEQLLGRARAAGEVEIIACATDVEFIEDARP
jgi:hypothetical protein